MVRFIFFMVIALCASPLLFAAGAPAPAGQPILAGTISGIDNASICKVTLWNGGALLSISPGENKHYEFPQGALAPGAYAISCSAQFPDRNSTSRALAPIKITAGQTRVEDFAFDEKYKVSGHVLYDDLSPAAGRIITARFEDRDLNREYIVSVTSGADGAYALSSPLPKTVFIGMVDDNGKLMVKPPMDAANGLANIDFVMPTGTEKEGLTGELTMTKDSFTTKETPSALLTVKNSGTKDYVVPAGETLWSIGVDGIWYVWSGPADVKSGLLKSGDVINDIPFALSKEWKAKDGSTLALPAGRHALSVAVTAEPGRKAAPARIESNRVWFEIKAEK